MANIVIAFPKMEDAIGIKNLLVRNGYPVTAVCTSGANVLSTIDDYNDGIVVCGYKLTDMLFSELRANMAGDFEMIDPLGIANLIDELEAEIDGFESAVDTALTVSNSTTFIKVE